MLGLPDGALNDGSLLRDPGGEIDVIFGGARFHVPDPGTLDQLFHGRPIIQLDAGVLNTIGTIPKDGTLLRDPGGEIDVVYGGTRFHIPNPEVLNAMFSGVPICQLWAGGLNQLPEGPWPPPSDLGVIAEFQLDGEISGPLTPNAGHITGVVQVIAEPGGARITVSAKCTNSSVIDNVEPTVVVQIITTTGDTVGQVVVDIPTVPARGGAPPTSRDGQSVIKIDRSFSVHEVSITYQNRATGIAVLNAIPWSAVVQIAGEIIKIIVE